MKTILLILTLSLVILVACTPSGIVRDCEYAAQSCGKCYCLQTKDRCLNIDYTEVGDLHQYLDKKINYIAAENVTQEEYCPYDIKILEIK